MGTWGYLPFENDGASDWASQLKKDGLKAIEAAIKEVLESKGYLEAPACENAIAAADALSALGKNPGSRVPDDVEKWIAVEKRRPTEDLLKKSAACIDLILTDSELKELWAESEDFPSWEAELKKIKVRLDGGSFEPSKKAWWKLW